MAHGRCASRLEHRRSVRRVKSDRRRRRISARRHRLVQEAFFLARGVFRAARLYRVRRRHGQQRRLDQRQAPGQAALRVCQLRLRTDEGSCIRKRQNQCPGRAGRQLRPAGFPVVHGRGHLPPRAPGGHGSCALRPVVHVRHDTAHRSGTGDRSRAGDDRESVGSGP